MSTVSTSSNNSRKNFRRLDSLRSEKILRNASRIRPTQVTFNESYTFALRAAYLHHLLQPRPKRKLYNQTAPPKSTHKASTASSIADVIGNFTSNAKSGKFPHGFMSPLEKRIQGVVVGTERTPGYNDAALKRTFAEAYTAFSETAFRKRMDKDRRVEDLVLIFFSNATKSLQKGRAPEDDSWKPLADRHVAMFVKLLIITLRESNGDKDLLLRLGSLEKKLLTEGQDLSTAVGEKDSFVETIASISYDVKDMVLVCIVARIFGQKLSQVQADIDLNRNVWTEEAALTDLKAYQYGLNSNSGKTLRSEDFGSDEAFHAWIKTEEFELSQLIVDIVALKPELAQTSSSTTGPIKPGSSFHAAANQQSSVEWSKTKNTIDGASSYGFDAPLEASIRQRRRSHDLSSTMYLVESPSTFVPPDTRAYYRSILVHASTFDGLHNAQAGANETSFSCPLSKASLDLLTEIGVRWRIPRCSRLVLFVDVTVQRFMDQDISLDELDKAFEFFKSSRSEIKQQPNQAYLTGLQSTESRLWPVVDVNLYRQSLSKLHESLLRELYCTIQKCYDPKPPPVGPVLTILDDHIYTDAEYSENPDTMTGYNAELERGLTEQADEVYRKYLENEIPLKQGEWQFFHVIKLGQDVVKLCQRIQKRYSKSPDIMGVNPLKILVATMLPMFEHDAQDLIQRIIQVASDNEVDINIEDGFDLYTELVEIRRIHQDALPDEPFAFDIESLLSTFVWQYITNASTRMTQLVDSAIAQDTFELRGENMADDDRHSHSVLDLFRIFNETIDLIFKLKWDNEEHHANFMTVLAKAFGVALDRYCEVIESKFTDEMDRPTPSSKAAESLSKQEKWVQLAKDTWNNRDKIEPFQFLPKSFVKLNNIEYAIQQLDKLENMMDVDACSDILSRINSQNPQRKKILKYVFTIKIVEAEDLKACDSNGFSDPYVVLVDEFQKRLTKTRVVEKSLNPRWEESVDITVQGPVNIIAMIWDSDIVGEDDYVGRTSIKLDPAHFGDYLPRECWLKLDTQGRLLLRISMEGERDDIQFYFGKAFRMLKRTERDMTRRITDKLSTYIRHTLSHAALSDLMSSGISLASMTNLWKSRQSGIAFPTYTQNDVENALRPLLIYFDENFAMMKRTLTNAAMIMVMTRLWKEVLVAVENILVPPLSDKPSSQRQLTQQELDIVYKWLELLFGFFNARDDETGEVLGVPSHVLKSPKWHELASLNFFYFDATENLIRTSERMASATAQKAQTQRSRIPAPVSACTSFGAAMGMTATRRGRAKCIMLSRNLGTMKRAKEDKRKEAQADPSDDMILRILRMRRESQATAYLRDRSRQKERLAAAAAAETIIRQSLAAGHRGVAGGVKFGGAGGLVRR